MRPRSLSLAAQARYSHAPHLCTVSRLSARRVGAVDLGGRAAGGSQSVRSVAGSQPGLRSRRRSRQSDSNLVERVGVCTAYSGGPVSVESLWTPPRHASRGGFPSSTSFFERCTHGQRTSGCRAVPEAYEVPLVPSCVAVRQLCLVEWPAAASSAVWNCSPGQCAAEAQPDAPEQTRKHRKSSA